MKSDRSDISSNLKFAHYYQLNSIPETMLPTENKHSNSAAYTHTSDKEIMVALGFIATLLFFSGMQLYRSVNVNPAQVKTTKRDRQFTFDTKNLITEMPLRETERFASFHRIEMLTIQNAISHGKF